MHEIYDSPHFNANGMLLKLKGNGPKIVGLTQHPYVAH